MVSDVGIVSDVSGPGNTSRSFRYLPCIIVISHIY